tara:strand:+ start:57 stop:179 length:123 start_codon:yes stop_codon:yes gene_type:complete
LNNKISLDIIFQPIDKKLKLKKASPRAETLREAVIFLKIY